MKKKILGTLLLASAMVFGVGFENKASANIGFTDMSSSHWAYDSVNKMAHRGVVRGFPSGEFKPNQEVTRAQSAMFLSRALNVDISNVSGNPYSDVNTSVNGYAEIIAMNRKGVFATVDKFNPYNDLTRAQMAKIIVESYNLKLEPNGKTFADVKSSHWANTYIRTIAEYGITTGITPTEFKPEETVSRAQMVAFLDRTEQIIASNPYVVKGNDKPVDNSTPPVTNPQQPPVDNTQPPVINPEPEDDGYARIDTTRDYQSSDPALEAEFIRLLNEYRVSLGLSTVTYYENLSKFASFRSWDMIENDYFAHVSPIYGPFDRMVTAFDNTLVHPNEVLASTFMNLGPTASAERVLGLWKSSPGHNHTLTQEGLTKVGLGIRTASDGYTSVVTVAVGY